MQVAVTAAVCAAALLFAAPNLASRAAVSKLPSWLPSKQVQLGLEFRGETMLLLEPDWPAVEHEWARELRNFLRQTLRDRRIRYEELRIVAGGAVQFRTVDPAMTSTVAEAVTSVVAEMPGVPVGEPAGVSVAVTGDVISITLDEGGRARLRSRALDAALVHRERALRRLADCRGVRDGVVSRDGDRLRLTFRTSLEGHDGCRHH